MPRNVTNRGNGNGHADVRRWDLSRDPLMRPGSHILTKNPLESVTVSWGVGNSGGAPGQAQLEVDGFVLPRLGPIVDVPAGSTVLLTLTTPIPVATGVTYNLRALAINVATNTAMAEHFFTVNVPAAPPPPTGAILTADPAGPTIT